MISLSRFAFVLAASSALRVCVPGADDADCGSSAARAQQERERRAMEPANHEYWAPSVEEDPTTNAGETRLARSGHRRVDGGVASATAVAVGRALWCGLHDAN